jgi:hypothetical protein
MRAELLNIPRTPEDWALWGFAHRDDHEIIRLAIQRQTGVNLPGYPLDPVPIDDEAAMARWFEIDQLAHNDMNNVLNLVGAALDEVDFNKPEEATAWIYLHRKEHEAAGGVLGV